MRVLIILIVIAILAASVALVVWLMRLISAALRRRAARAARLRSAIDDIDKLLLSSWKGAGFADDTLLRDQIHERRARLGKGLTYSNRAMVNALTHFADLARLHILTIDSHPEGLGYQVLTVAQTALADARGKEITR